MLRRDAAVLLVLKNSNIRACLFSFSNFNPFCAILILLFVRMYSRRVGRMLIADGNPIFHL